MKKIDIHSHILPGLDDGSSGERESLDMARMAARQGVQSIIATPHYSMEFQNLEPERIIRQCRMLEHRIQQELGGRFHIYPGQEIFYSQDVPELLDRGKLLTMAGSPYVLVEFHPAVPYSVIFGAVRNLVHGRYNPIIAHAERYSALREKGRPQELREIGASLQLNYRRIGGKWYDDTARWCRKMLREEQIEFLATDMHNKKDRRPDTQAAQEWMEKHLDPLYIEAITYKNARKIIAWGKKKEANTY